MAKTEAAVDAFAGLPAIFRECCDPTQGNRLNLDAPFWRDGYLYATDGRICVRREIPFPPPEPAAWTDQNRKVPKRPADIFPVGTQFGDPVAIPEGVPAAPVVCGKCKCKGETKGVCEACDGNGLCSCPRCDEPHDCGSCDGTGVARCYKCDGLGRLLIGDDTDSTIPVGRLQFDRVLLARLKAGGVTHLRLPLETEGPVQPARFDVDGCEGRVMPCKVVGVADAV